MIRKYLLHISKRYVVHIKTLKILLNQGLILALVQITIKFYQKVSLKPWTEMSTEFCNNFGKLCDLKLMKTDIRRNCVVSEPNCHITEQIFENCLEKNNTIF